MSYSASDSPTDSIAHWIDTSLISDPALLNLMESYNWTPFLGHELGSILAQNAFAVTTSQAATSNFELTNGLRDEYMLSGTQRKTSIVKSDATSKPCSTLEQRSQVTEKPAPDGVAKAKKEVSEHWSWMQPSICDGSDLYDLETSRAKPKSPASFQAA
jgi:hypothetical protein